MTDPPDGRLPWSLRLPAALGLCLIVLPLAALTGQVDWARSPDLLRSPSSLDALSLSLRTALAATGLSALLGIPLAVVLARGTGRWVAPVRAVVLVPLVLPPVVSGIALLAAFGRRGLLGAPLDALGWRIAFSTVAVVLAETFVALPFLVVTLEGALRSHGVDHERVAATLGADPATTLRRVTLPLLWPALRAGLVLAFARALGEFGATITFAGSLQGVTRTLPLEIYLQREVDPAAAVALSLLLVVVAVVVILLTSRRRPAW